MSGSDKKFIRVLKGEVFDTPPFWFMRQAGRYLPEYRELRQKAGSFLDLCFNPEMAVEVTMQPIRRYGMDAAILFSDILVIPYALGQDVSFVAGEGPKLDPIRSVEDLSKLSFDHLHEKLEPVYQTIQGLTETLDDQTALIGFAGSPWTVATYMVEGGSSKTFEIVKKWAYQDPNGFSQLMDILIPATAEYLIEQVNRGAEALQLFDSWSGVLPAHEFHSWVIEPTQRIVRKIRRVHPDVPIIGFPKGAGVLYRDYADRTNVSALSMDTSLPVDWAATRLQIEGMPLQGNLDPVMLLVGGRAMDYSAKYIIDALRDGPFVFNLGHGVIKETPPEHVAQLAEIIRTHK